MLTGLIIAIAVIGAVLLNRRNFLPFRSILSVSDPVNYLFYDREEDRLITVSLSPEIWIESPHGLGWYPISSFWELGSFDNRGGEVLSTSFQAGLSLPVEGYIYRSAARDDVFGPGFIMDLLRGRIDSNFSPSELFGIYWHFKLMKPHKNQNYSLNALPVVTERILPDESKRQELQHNALKPFFGTVFELTVLRRENIPLSIVNASSAVGLARSTSELLERIGLTIVRVSTAPENESLCEIYYGKKTVRSVTLATIRKMFSCHLRESSAVDFDGITLTIGEGYAKLIKS